MTASDEPAEPLAESTEAPREGGRALTVGLVIGLVLCLLLAVGIALSTRQHIADLARERDAARSEVEKATAANVAKTEQLMLGARADLAELAQLLVVTRQNAFTGKDISDPVLPDSIGGKRRAALTAALALRHANVPFKWGSRKKESGLDSVGFVAVALSEAGMLLKPETLTTRSLQNLVNVTAVGEPEPGDILFFDNGIVMLYLGGDNAVGMLPEGPATKGGVLKGKGIGFKYQGYGTVRY